MVYSLTVCIALSKRRFSNSASSGCRLSCSLFPLSVCLESGSTHRSSNVSPSLVCWFYGRGTVAVIGVTLSRWPLWSLSSSRVRYSFFSKILLSRLDRMCTSRRYWPRFNPPPCAPKKRLPLSLSLADAVSMFVLLFLFICYVLCVAVSLSPSLSFTVETRPDAREVERCKQPRQVKKPIPPTTTAVSVTDGTREEANCLVVGWAERGRTSIRRLP